MEILKWKIRFSLLWVFLAVATSANMILSLAGPGVIEELISGKLEGAQITNGTLLMLGLLWLIPLIMAILCFTLKDSVNRWLNFVLAIILGIFYITDMVESIGQIAQGLPYAGPLLLTISGIVVAAFIARFSWSWPKQQV